MIQVHAASNEATKLCLYMYTVVQKNPNIYEIFE